MRTAGRTACVALVAGGTASMAAAQQCLWTGIATPTPSQRTSFGLAFDSGRGRAVLFGGHSYSPWADLGDTWEWNGTVWSQSANTGPYPRWGVSMAYDAARARTVLYGGIAEVVPFNRDDTWEWDGQAWTLAAAIGPGATSYFPVMLYDAYLQRITQLRVTGSSSGPTQFWDWNGTTWTLRTGPGVASLGQAAYDSARSRVVMYAGGQIGEFDSAGETWTQRQSTGLHPVGLRLIGIDPVRGKAVFYGGNASVGFPNQYDLGRETWEWDTATGVWTLITNARPQGIEEARGYYDPSRMLMVMMAAHYPNTAPNEVWEYNALGGNPGLIFTQSPESLSLTPGQTAVFHVAATGAKPVTIQWRRNGQPLQNGGNVSGVTTGTLTIGPVVRADEGIIDALVTDACGPAVSLRGVLGVTVPCYANCDQSTGAPMINANDFQCFLNTYAAGCGDPTNCYVNCDGSTIAPILTANDFQCFLNAYAAGCP